MSTKKQPVARVVERTTRDGEDVPVKDYPKTEQGLKAAHSHAARVPFGRVIDADGAPAEEVAADVTGATVNTVPAGRDATSVGQTPKGKQ